MNRRACPVLLWLLVVLGATAVPLQAAERDLRIREVDTGRFPTVSVTIAFDEAVGVTSAGIRVIEDGARAEILGVRPLGESGRTVDVVLAVDVSGSMRGEPLAAAVDAARGFVRGLPEGVRVGILTFAEGTRVAQRLTSDRGALLGALGSLEVRGETALYDAVVAAAGMFSGTAQRNIILLSDGGNTIGTATLGAAVDAAREAEAAVFAVGLRSPETDVRALRTIASRTGGRYAPSNAADLEVVFEGLATQLANQFLVTYRSSVPGGEFTLTVEAAGGSDSTLVMAPGAVVPPQPTSPPSPVPVPVSRPILRGAVGLAVVLVLTFLGAFSLATMILGASARQRRERALAHRIQGGSAPAQHAGAGGEESIEGRTLLPGPLAALGARLAGTGEFSRGLDRQLEKAGLPLRAGEFLLLQTIAAMIGALLGALVGGLLFVVVFAVAAAAIPRVFLAVAIRRRSRQLHEQLADVLMLLSSSLRAGHSFLQALDLVTKEIGDPGAQEFGRVVSEIRLGRPSEDALNDMAERVDSDDFRWAVMAVNIQREVGGNLAEVLDTVANTVRERDTVRRQIRVLSAEGRLSAGIITALPFLIALYIAKVNPGYLNTLFDSALGIAMVVGAGVLMITGVLWMRKMVRIDV